MWLGVRTLRNGLGGEGGQRLCYGPFYEIKINTRILLRRGGSLESRFLALRNVHHTFKTIKNNQIKKN